MTQTDRIVKVRIGSSLLWTYGNWRRGQQVIATTHIDISHTNMNRCTFAKPVVTSLYRSVHDRGPDTTFTNTCHWYRRRGWL